MTSDNESTEKENEGKLKSRLERPILIFKIDLKSAVEIFVFDLFIIYMVS